MTRLIVIPELESAPPAQYNYWSQDAKIITATYYGIKDTTAIAQYLDKTNGALQSKAADLGIKFDSTTEEREEIIRQIEAGEK